MTKRNKFFAITTFLLLLYGHLHGGGKVLDKSRPLAQSSVHFEQNATDGDVEVVFDVRGEDVGLTKLVVVSPDGRSVIDFSAPDTSTLGIRSFRFESSEPRNIESLKSAYPEGLYSFTGKTIDGDILQGESILNHTLPAAASFLWPLSGAKAVDTRNLEISWTPVKDLSAYIIEIEQEALNIKIVAKLSNLVSTFTVPDTILLPGKVYDLSIGTVTDAGNISFVETSFATAKKN